MKRFVIFFLLGLFVLAGGCRTAPRSSRSEMVGEVRILWPMNSLKRSGDPHTFVLKVEDLQNRPIAGYMVRWSLIDDESRVQAHLGIREQKIIEGNTDANGEVETTIYRANQADGIKPVLIEVFDTSSKKIAENSVYVTWSTCPVCHLFRKTGPASCAVGKNIVCTLEISNPGSDDMNEVVIIDTLPEGFVFLESSEPPSYMEGKRVVWELGHFPVGSTRQINVTLQAVQAGTWVNTAMLSARDLQPKNTTTITTVTEEK